MITRTVKHDEIKKTILIIYSDVEKNTFLKEKIKTLEPDMKIKINELPERYLKGVMILQNF